MGEAGWGEGNVSGGKIKEAANARLHFGLINFSV